jgi:N-glycosylase/DNA lyase
MEGKAIDSGGKKDNPPRINRAQDTYLSNCRQKQKAREERKRIEKEQAYINAGSWDDWDKMEEENEKERVKEQTRLDQKREQEIEERAAKREALRQASTTRIPPSPVRE